MDNYIYVICLSTRWVLICRYKSFHCFVKAFHQILESDQRDYPHITLGEIIYIYGDFY